MSLQGETGTLDPIWEVRFPMAVLSDDMTSLLRKLATSHNVGFELLWRGLGQGWCLRTPVYRPFWDVSGLILGVSRVSGARHPSSFVIDQAA